MPDPCQNSSRSWRDGRDFLHRPAFESCSYGCGRRCVAVRTLAKYFHSLKHLRETIRHDGLHGEADLGQ
jgi:arginyl-tRNA--protein-N-Asp/Glu arginylyltransferase